jgi:hypothetical protein
MNLDLKSLKPTRKIQPPRIILYGPPGVGKSTFASNISGAVFLDVEGGTGNLPVVRIDRDRLETADGVTAALNAVLSQDHGFTAVVIDSADFLEKVLQKQVAQEHGVADFGKIGYGKGPVTLVNVWRGITQLLDEIRERRNMAVVLIAHETLKKINDPDTETYDKQTLAMENKSVEHLEAWCDCIFFAKQEVYTQKDKQQRVRATAGDRMLYTEDCPAYLAKNRYGLPRELPFSWSAFHEAFAKATTFAEPKPEKKGKEAA